MTKEPPADVTGWQDWKGELISERARRRRLAVGPPQQPLHHDAGQRAQRGRRLRGPGRRPDRRDHLRRPHQRPRAAGARDHRPGRGRVRRPDARRRGDLRRRGRRRSAALRPDVDAPVHGVRRGRLRRALDEDHRRGHRPADLRARELVPARRGRPLPLAGLPREPARAAVAVPASRTARSPVGRRPSAYSRPWRSSSSTGVEITREDLEHRSSPSTTSGGARRWASARSTSSAFDRLPEEIWEAHRRVSAALDAEA